ncbi:Fic family protein [Vulgatibacter incomptus]|uniref:Fic family protein n=1 Tax=Vulgatibacter incomptus TaxID=1391653 RepID=A0A0K1PFG8_9BACT|nr:Fic family protein [Vulgatibacter incomptus]AKU91859.1 Fic family protein [Vulgatibacter incomptus]
MPFIHERAGWPALEWDLPTLAERLADVRHRQGRLFGRMEGIGFPLRSETLLQTLTADVITSSEIEGEILDRAQVRSSIARRLGIDEGGLQPVDRNVEGMVEMMLDATQRFAEPLAEERLCGWHAVLFPTGFSGMRRIRVGGWRPEDSGPMQVVSGPIGRERVHFVAPAPSRVPSEMGSFLDWFESGAAPRDPVLRAGLAHLRFVTIHPFEDGNGRIARAITDLALARSDGSSQRYYSMSAQVCRERKGYYEILESTQRGTPDVTPWLDWFLRCLGRAIEGAEATLASVLDVSRFWDEHPRETLNERQRIVIQRLLGPWTGKLTTSKWAKLAKCSQDTALRDISELIARGILRREASGGRSTSYALVGRAASPSPERDDP